MAALAFEFANAPLYDCLGGDPGMVRSGLPQRVKAAHTVIASQDVLKRAVQGVAKVQSAGDVGKRDDDYKRPLVWAAVGRCPERAGLLPGSVHLWFDIKRVVDGIQNGVLGHLVSSRIQGFSER